MQNFKISTRLVLWKYKRGPVSVLRANLAILADSFPSFKKLIIGVVEEEIPSMIYKLERPRND